jgi:para-nitrobenzyl esterase
MSDLVFHAPAVLLADTLASAGGEVYFYRFDGTLPLVGGYTGSFHGLDIPFVFGTIGRGALAWTMGASPAVRTLSRNIQRAWVRFAHAGAPAHEGLPAWPRWESASRDAMLLGHDSRITQDPHERAREFWNPLLEAPRQDPPAVEHRRQRVTQALPGEDQPPRVARE